MNLREQILHMLQDAQGAFVSGQDISLHLGVSRTAVWKHIHALTQSGIQIEAVTNCGYRLLSEPVPTIDSALCSQIHTEWLGRQMVVLQETDSTNHYLKALSLEGAANGTAVFTESQSAGRGRRGRGWESAPYQNIMLSLLLRPQLETAKAPRYTIATALGVYQTLHKYDIDAAIKWPNDVLAGGKKLCGILLEMEGTMDHLDAVIVGLGLNVNAASFADDTLADTATSMRLITGQSYDRSDVLRTLLETLEPLYIACEDNGAYATLLGDYMRVCATLGRQVQVVGIAETFHGIAEDVDDIGHLLVRTADGVLRTVSAGDVSIR